MKTTRITTIPIVVQLHSRHAKVHQEVLIRIAQILLRTTTAIDGLRHRVPTITDQLRAVADHHQLEAPQAVGLQEVAHHEGDNLNNQKHEVHRNN